MKLPKITDSIHNTYSPLALKELKGVIKRSKDLSGRRELSGITIDQYYSRDLDDGIWAYRDGKNHVIQVSIADVTELVHDGTHLDWEARSRATSVYFDTHVLHMFPEQISTDLASLNHKTKRLAITVEIVLDENYDTVSVAVFESVFYNKNRLDYEKFYSILSDKTDPMSEDLSYFLEIAKNLAPKRKHLNFSDDDRKICISGDCFQEDVSTENPSFLIQEFMILANKEVARWMMERGIISAFRNHMPEYKGKEFEGIMRRAFYNYKMEYHYALGLDYYCHFTSPIRRYADMIVHRQIKAFLNPEKWIEYSFYDVRVLTLYINEQVYNLKKLQANKELEDEKKRHERIFNKVVSGEDVKDFSRISVHLFEKILKHIIEKNLPIAQPLRSEIFNRLEGDLVKGDLLFSLFFFNDEKIANKAFYMIHKNSLQKPFFTFVGSLQDFRVDYNRYRHRADEYLHVMSVKYNSSEVITTTETTVSRKNMRKKMSESLFTKFREWRDIEYFKKEKKIKGFA